MITCVTYDDQLEQVVLVSQGLIIYHLVWNGF